MSALKHADYPHTPGYLYDCPACESRCHCTPGNAECVFEGAHKMVTGRVVRVIRHGHTYYGNPTMSVVLEGDPWGVMRRISDNASLVYGIENREFRETPHTFALTRAGRISHVIRGGVS